MFPKISVIIVVFNGSKTIENAIQSVLRQTYKNIDLVIVDGGSYDGTVEILKKYNSGNYFWKSEPDKGIYDAMNKGIMEAKGEWIYFLGSDDTLFEKSVIEQIFTDNKNLDYDFIYGNVWKNNTKYDGSFDKRKILIRNISHQCIFYKKAIHEKLGYYNTCYKIFADWDFNLRCFFNSEIKIIYKDIVVANFAEGGMSREYNDLEFFRKVLFPKSLSALEIEGIRKMNNVCFFDWWWRLLRSMKLIEKDDKLSTYSGDIYLPKVINRMQIMQKSLPPYLLRIGVFSKFFMFVSYCVLRLTPET